MQVEGKDVAVKDNGTEDNGLGSHLNAVIEPMPEEFLKGGAAARTSRMRGDFKLEGTAWPLFFFLI